MLSRSVSAFWSFMREYLDPIVKADQCAQDVDDIGIAANKATELTHNLQAVPVHSHLPGGSENDNWKVPLWSQASLIDWQNHFIWVVSPQTYKSQNFLNKLRFPKSKTAWQRYLGFVKGFRNYFPRKAEKLNPSYKLLEAEIPTNTTSELKKNLWFSKQSTEWCLWTCIETTHSWETASLNDGCKLQKRCLCPHDWR